MSDDTMLQERKTTYHGFVGLVVYSTAAGVAVLALMAILLL